MAGMPPFGLVVAHILLWYAADGMLHVGCAHSPALCCGSRAPVVGAGDTARASADRCDRHKG